MKKIGIAILGVGRWGVHLVRNFLAHPQANLLAIADPNQERLDYCRQQFDLDRTDLKLTTNWESIQQNSQINALVIATPASTHYQLIKEALKLGYHVLSEKPLTLNFLECEELTRIAQEKKLQLFIDHTYLFHPAVKKGQEIIKKGDLGTLRYGYASRTNLGPVRQDVDALWDLAIHDLAIFNHFLGQNPVKVQAEGQVWLQENLADLVWLKLFYADGFIANIHLCWLNPDKQRKLSLVGSKGTLVFDEMQSQSPLTLQKGFFEQQGNQFIPTGVKTEVLPLEKAEPLKLVCDRFLDNINNHKDDQLSSGKLATNLVKILQALSLSLEKNGMIIDC
jgi:predicted dehydrogenase